MTFRQRGKGGKLRILLPILLTVSAAVGSSLAEEESPPAGEPPAPAEPSPAEDEKKQEWQPALPMPDKFDWIQLTSDEWLKGEIIAMYDRELEFDSDELDLLTLDWEDIKQVRSAQVLQVGFLGDRSATGKFWMEGDTIRLIGEETKEFDRSQILTIAIGSPSELSHWSGKVSLGLTVREGNSDQVESNARANFKRRTIENRVIMDYLANYNTTDDVEVANNHRASVIWDKFITDRFFLKPITLEYFRDPFQNIGSRSTIGVGAGFQLIDTSKTDWEVSGGPAYQETQFDTVQANEDDSESTAAFTIGTIFDQEWTKSIDFLFEYRFQLTSEAAGEYNHHLVMSFETEWTSLLDFDLMFVWDRTEKPREDDLGDIPEQDDFRMIVGLGIEF